MNYQATLQAIQTLNLLDCFHAPKINHILRHSAHHHHLNQHQHQHQHNNFVNALQPNPQQQYKIYTMALALLSLCAKLHERHPPKVRTLAKIVHPSHQDIDLNVLENGEGRKEHVLRGRNVGSLGELEEEIKEWEGKIMVWLRWKLAVPLLYD